MFKIKNYTKEETERRQKLSLVVEQLARITNQPSCKMYGIAGRFINRFGYRVSLEELTRCNVGLGIPALWKIVEKQYEQSTDYTTLQDVAPDGVKEFIGL